MLKITVSLVHGRRGEHEEQLGELRIGRTGMTGTLADYDYQLSANDLPEVQEGKIEGYPRWSASVWDLVARALAKGLYGKEQLGERPESVESVVPVHKNDYCSFVRFGEIPEPARSAFDRSMSGSGVPVPDGAYLHDWLDFLKGGR